MGSMLESERDRKSESERDPKSELERDRKLESRGETIRWNPLRICLDITRGGRRFARRPSSPTSIDHDHAGTHDSEKLYNEDGSTYVKDSHVIINEGRVNNVSVNEVVVKDVIVNNVSFSDDKKTKATDQS